MKCSQCGTNMEAASKFCTNCGAVVQEQTETEALNKNGSSKDAEETVAATAENAETKEDTNKVAVTAEGAEKEPNEFVEKTKAIGKSYLDFFIKVYKSPFTASKQVTESDKINAIITLVLFSLFLPLYSFTLAKKVSSGYFTIPFFDTVLVPFFVFLIFFAAVIGIHFGISKLLKVELSFLHILSIFGALMIMPTSIILVALLFVLVSVNMFTTIFFSVGIALMALANVIIIFVMRTYTKDSNNGIDPIYAVFIANVAISIVLLIIGDSIMGAILNQVPTSLW